MTARRTLRVLVLTCAFVLPFAPSAHANRSGQGGATDPPRGGAPSPGSISSRVSIKISTDGSGQAVTSTDVNWSPPACWFEPRYTPDEYKSYMLSRWTSGQSAHAVVVRELEKTGYNKGKKGMWWGLTYNGAMPRDRALDACLQYDEAVWVGPGDTPDAPVITPEMLSRLAYQATKLPAPPVGLSPRADLQKVNLPVHAAFDAPLERVTVTASLNYGGVNIAATTVATPVAVEMDAGTEYAEPQSCVYKLTASHGNYALNSKEEPCNVTYRRSSLADTYPL
jgi:hypothetical protein